MSQIILLCQFVCLFCIVNAPSTEPRVQQCWHQAPVEFGSVGFMLSVMRFVAMRSFREEANTGSMHRRFTGMGTTSQTNDPTAVLA